MYASKPATSRVASCLLVLLAACSSDGSASHDASMPAAASSDAATDADAARADAAHPASPEDAALDAFGSADEDTGMSADGSDGSLGDAGTPAGLSCAAPSSYGSPLSAAALTADKIMGGLAGAEGPVWISHLGVLLFSEMLPPAGADGVQPSKIWRLSLPSTLEVWLDPSGSNGLALSPDEATLIAATHDTQSLSSYSVADRARATIVADYQGMKFHSPNDLTVRSDGTIYFTDPSYQQGNRHTGIVVPTAVYRVGTGKQAVVVDDTLANPNGIALSPDEKTLYVGSDAGVLQYAVHADGSTGASRPFVSGLDAPDGMTVDCAGNVYVAEYNTGLVHVYSSAAIALGTIATSAHATNVAFGGDDHKTLFITAGGAGSDGYGVYRIDLAVPGRPY